MGGSEAQKRVKKVIAGCIVLIIGFLLIRRLWLEYGFPFHTTIPDQGYLQENLSDEAMVEATLPTVSPLSGLRATLPRDPQESMQPSREPARVLLHWDVLTVSEVTYQLPMTAQFAGSDRVVVSFILSASRPGVLCITNLSDANHIEQIIEIDALSMQQQITIDRLHAGSLYQIRLGLDRGDGIMQDLLYGAEIWEPLEIRVPDSRPKDIHVAVIGDSGFGDQTLRELIAVMAGYPLDLTLHTGDVVYNMHEHETLYDAYAQKYYLPFAPLLARMPIYPVPGNHDYDQAGLWDGRPFYFTVFPRVQELDMNTEIHPRRRQWYSFTYDAAEFFMLDSQVIMGIEGRSEQRAWLQERLMRSDAAIKIIVSHAPPFSSGRHQADGLALQQDWHALFIEAGITLVLCGHDHNYERMQVDGITYIVTGGGSSVLYPAEEMLPESEVFLSRAHFVYLEINTERIGITAISHLGELLDEVEIIVSE